MTFKIDKIKILIVDDKKDNLLALNAILVRDDLNIFLTQSGNEALELMMKHDFCIALLDVQMPDMSGFELAELMRGTNKTKNIPIIFVTATAKEQNFLFKGYESGAVDFLLKPLDNFAVKSKVNIFVELYRQKQNLKKIHFELERAIQMRDDFMSMASHELKTPLTSLMLQAQMRKRYLQKGEMEVFTTEKLTKMFNTDEKQLKRITYLINDMLDVSKISAEKFSMNLEQFDFCELIKELIEMNSELFKMAGCPVKTDICSKAVGTWDRIRMEQVIMNLLTNAMRYGAGKPIFVQVSMDTDGVQIVIRDEGQGISSENHNRIFQKFERAASVKQISGLGLGLYIVKQIIQRHQGTIHLESKINQGSCFTVILPFKSDFVADTIPSLETGS